MYPLVYNGFTMRTNIELDSELVAEAQKLSDIETKKGVVHEALRYFVETKRRRHLSDLRGKIELAPGYAIRQVRELRTIPEPRDR